MILVSAILITVGLLTPAFTIDTLIQSPNHVSILAGAWQSLHGEEAWIGIVVILFSAVFPAFKLWGLARIVRHRHPGDAKALIWLELLGKWSMLDVFVVATLVGAARLRFLSEVEARYGVYIFALGILVSVALTAVLAEQRRVRQFTLKDNRNYRVAGLILSLAALTCFVTAITSPLLQIEKWLFWENRFSLLTAPNAMYREGEYLLPVVLVVFVIILPALRIGSLVFVQALPRPPAMLVNATYRIGRWAMLDVYALAMAVVMVKLGDFADFTPLMGLWLLMAAAIVSTFSGMMFRARLCNAGGYSDQ